MSLAPPPYRDAPLLSLAFCLAVGAMVRFGLLWGHDLRGAFGPDAPGAAAAATTGIFAHPYPLHPLLIRLFALAGGGAAQAALLLSITAGLATVGAAWLMGRVLTDGRDGRSVALLAAVAPLLVHGSLLRGGDALAVCLVAWGAGLGWWGALRVGGATPSTSGPRLALVAGGLLWGLSAAAKPIALPAGVLLLAAPMLGGRRCLPWLGAGLALGALVALPFLGPLLRPEPAMGLLGSWWQPSPPTAAGLGSWVVAGAGVLFGLLQRESWTQLAPLAGLALAGCVVAAPRRSFRIVVFFLGTGAALGVAAMMGERLQARYLAGASLGWLVLAGLALTPAQLRRGSSPGAPSWGRVLLGPLPLSFGATLLVMANLYFWDGMAQLRVQEEGTVAPEGFFAGWTDGWRPTEAFQDSSICGALELGRLADELAQRSPRSGVVVTLPLRDGRAWHLLGPIAAARDDLVLLELGPECCPAGPAACAAALPGALAAAGGGSLVVPMEPAGRCETGSLPHGLQPWREALVPLVVEPGLWYGVLTVPPGPGAGLVPICTALGGRQPALPARP